MKGISLAGIWTPKLYDRIAKYYDAFSWLVSPTGEIAQKRVIGGLSSGSILDVGCGTGTLLALARANGLTCYGIDTSAGMLDQARTKVPNAELKQASFYDIPYPDEFFDYVVETNALAGVAIDVRQALSEMMRVCRTGGQVRIADYATPARETWRNRLVKRMLFLTGDLPQDFQELFKELGYEAEVEILGGYDMYQFFTAEKKEPGEKLNEG